VSHGYVRGVPPVSILDLAPIVEGGTPAQALRNSIDLVTSPRSRSRSGCGALRPSSACTRGVRRVVRRVISARPRTRRTRGVRQRFVLLAAGYGAPSTRHASWRWCSEDATRSVFPGSRSCSSGLLNRPVRPPNRSRGVSEQTTVQPRSSGNKALDSVPRFGSTKRLNRRFRKQIGGLLIRGSQVRILAGA
jgi:hypothetical protein